MTFTNSDCVENDICWQVKAQLPCYVWNQVNEQVIDQVVEQVNWKVYGQINLIKYKIKQDINK